MRRTLFAVLALAAALIIGLFTASVAGAQAPAATIDAEASVWQPPNVTISTGETVRWTFAGETVDHNVKSTSANWDVDTADRHRPGALSTTPSRRPASTPSCARCTPGP